MQIQRQHQLSCFLLVLFVGQGFAWTYESISSYQMSLVKPTGTTKYGNSALTTSWPASFDDGDNPSVVFMTTYLLPDELDQSDVTLYCILNRGDPVLTNASDDDDLWQTLTTGASNTDNFQDVLCGGTVNVDDWMVTGFYTAEQQSDDKLQETADAIIAMQRLYYIKTDTFTPEFSLSTGDNEMITITYTLKHPIQGMRSGFDTYAVVNYVAKNANGWVMSDGPDFCSAPSSYSDVDPNYEDTFTISMTRTFEQLKDWGMSVVSGTTTSGDPTEELTFSSHLHLLDCADGSDVVDTVTAAWFTSGTVIYNLAVSAVADIATGAIYSNLDPAETVLQMDATLMWCGDDSSCADPQAISNANFIVGQVEYAILSIDGSSRLFGDHSVFLYDNAAQKELSGAISVSLVDDETAGQVVYSVQFLTVYASATLTFEAEAQPTGRRLETLSRLLEDDADDVTRGHYGKASRTVNITETETDDETDGAVMNTCGALAFTTAFCLASM